MSDNNIELPEGFIDEVNGMDFIAVEVREFYADRKLFDLLLKGGENRDVFCMYLYILMGNKLEDAAERFDEDPHYILQISEKLTELGMFDWDDEEGMKMRRFAPKEVFDNES